MTLQSFWQKSKQLSKNLGRSVALGSYRLILLLTPLVYGSVLVAPDSLWVAAFVAFFAPLFWVGHFLMFLFWVWKRNYRFLYALLFVLLGLPFVSATVGFLGYFNFSTEKDNNALALLSYNVYTFNIYDEDLTKKTAKKQIKWLLEEKSTIKCLQEFYQQPQDSIFDLIAKFEKSHTPYHFFKSNGSQHNRGEFGLAIFSAYPIVGKGTVAFPNRTSNGAIYADLKVGSDTVRCYNVHLQSMKIDETQIELPQKRADWENSELWEKLWYRAGRPFKKGAIERGRQVAFLKQHIEASPYPVLLCGDMNDLPYSYTYFSFWQSLSSAFERRGRGLGFSYRGERLFFLRIDHIFYDFGKMPYTLSTFETLSDISYSDHYPIKATFEPKKK
ncbi:endonuclease/exonuclease/phosphatase family protein [Hugenholtzia roseola]|uniref:endonuclease/exonuclease/phosphatase family protein n=1 Tax=Hugenholtzia roseola TaxID=1002 RepID=UPI0004133B9D|nr:endonuclease/exonuclease/phosphatase family protein [Hugenholtzia roseola]